MNRFWRAFQLTLWIMVVYRIELGVWSPVWYGALALALLWGLQYTGDIFGVLAHKVNRSVV